MKCFKCGKVIESSYKTSEIDGWDAPAGGVHFEGGWNYGSSIYDAMLDGIHAELVICDECLVFGKGAGTVRDMRKIYTPVKTVIVKTKAEKPTA